MNTKSIAAILLFSITFLFAITSFAQKEEPKKDELKSGWYLWDPYQYLKVAKNPATLTGLDVKLVKEIGKLLNLEINYEAVSWRQHQLDLRTGKRDLAAGATFTKERAKFVHFSIPYRFEENSLFVRRGEENLLSFDSIEEFLENMTAKRFRIGVIDGFIYADRKINQWIKDPNNLSLISLSNNDSENVEKLRKGKIDGFLADRIVGATTIWRRGLGEEINEIRLNIKTPIHLMLSKKTISKDYVKKVNEAITELKDSRKYNELVASYLHPVMLLQTVDATWFRLVEIIGAIAMAISGLVIAYRKRVTLFSAIVFATLPSLGGGLIRDLVFDKTPVRVLEYPTYCFSVLITILIAFVLVRLSERFARGKKLFKFKTNLPIHILATSEALGLAAFSISGIVISVVTKVSPLWLWGPFFALVTGAGGGIMRDLISKQDRIMGLRGGILPEVAIIWAFALSIFLTYQSKSVDTDLIGWAVIVTILGIFTTRMIIYFFNIPNIYFHKEKDDS